jgi:hypothetical protein
MDSVSLILLLADLYLAGADLSPGHWAHQPTKLYYNGVPHAEVMDVSVPPRNGIDREYFHFTLKDLCKRFTSA